MTAIASKYDKSPAQVLLRWHIEEGIVPVPRAGDEKHLAQNIDVFDFTLSSEDMATLELGWIKAKKPPATRTIRPTGTEAHGGGRVGRSRSHAHQRRVRVRSASMGATTTRAGSPQQFGEADRGVLQ
ncbi:aldo/keto reductase [Microbacterium sp. NRRL B-14842]|uniref:aldo/keto reductase n=1 Tax=Microbacterium sp. NRRL B-14842 TaxID=3162881 RepID=UPI003D2AED10